MRKIDRYEMCVDSECTGKWRWFNGDLLVFSPDIHVGAIADAGDSCVVFRRTNAERPPSGWTTCSAGRPGITCVTGSFEEKCLLMNVYLWQI